MSRKSKVTIESGGKSVETSVEGIEELTARLEAGSPLPVHGPLLKALIGCVCEKPDKDDPERPTHSVGVSFAGLAATNTKVAVAVGPVQESYLATSRRSARLEAEREIIYGGMVRGDNIERLCADEAGPIPFPAIHIPLGRLEEMQETITLDASLLLAAAKVAVAAGSRWIRLYERSGEKSELGFRFEYVPDDQGDLFGSVSIDPVPVCGMAIGKIERVEVDGGGEEP